VGAQLWNILLSQDQSSPLENQTADHQITMLSKEEDRNQRMWSQFYKTKGILSAVTL